MPCETVKIGDSYAIVCSRGRQPRECCAYCKKPCEKLCDFPVGERLKRGVKREDGSIRYFRECSKPMCLGCAAKVIKPAITIFAASISEKPAPLTSERKPMS